MPSPDVIRRLTAVGLFLLPVGLVKLTDLYMGKAGPMQALAAEADPAAPSAQSNSVKAPTWTTRQIDAGKYIAKLRGMSFSPTPFLYEVHDDGSTPMVTVSTDPVGTPPAMVDASKFTLQAILSSSIGKTALIDGKPYREGETIRDSAWVVQSIAIDKRSVTLKESAQGRVLTIMVEIPTIGK